MADPAENPARQIPFRHQRRQRLSEHPLRTPPDYIAVPSPCAVLPRLLHGVAVCLLIAACARLVPGGSGLEKIEHIIVIYAENRSFDHLYGLFPGADGLGRATAEQKTQLDRDGTPLAHLPPVWKEGTREPDPRFPRQLPNGPFRLDAPPINLPPSVQVRNLVHRYYQNQAQIADGRNNQFAALSDAGGLVMGYYDGSYLRLWKIAREFVLADHFFMGAFGGSYFNHFWLVCACTAQWPDAPANERAQLDNRGRLKVRPGSPPSALDGPPQFLDGDVTPDRYVVNTAQPPYQPSGHPPAAGGDPRVADPTKHPLPPQTMKTIGDTLSTKGVSWAWYAGAWNRALADGMQPASVKRSIIYSNRPRTISFQPHHHPFNYFARFAPGTADRQRHLKDAEDLFAGIDAGKLPQVSFYKPYGELTQHPAYTDVLTGDEHVAGMIERIRKSPLWPRVAIIVTYDENGGWWDHAPPPRGEGWSDRWGPGTRIPAIIVSPYAKRGYVDKTPYDTTSIIKFITRRFGLEPLPGVRPKAGDLINAFDVSQPPGR
jgi:acid phosphatase